MSAREETSYPQLIPADGTEPEEIETLNQRPLERTSDLNRYLKYHDEIMSTWRVVQREYM